MLDTREGYQVAERDAETRAMKTLFGQMIALRDKDHEAIHHALERQGVKPDESGSFQATIHSAATSVRAAITGLDANALSPFISGEEKIVEEYDARSTRHLSTPRPEACSRISGRPYCRKSPR